MTTYSDYTNCESDLRSLLGQILLNHHWISLDQLEQLLLDQPNYQQPLGELLLNEAYISPVQLETALQEQYWRRNGYWVID